MDYNSESELIESLDYLTLPVKRSSSTGAGTNSCGKNETQFQRTFRNKVSHKTQTTHSLHKCNDAKNSRKKEDFEHNAIKTTSDKCLGQSNTSPIKPSLIKVTITHKKPKLNVSRRKQNPKSLHNTVSVEDRSIQTKHMCSFITGRKRERQYYIKTTESAKHLKDLRKRNDGISLDQVKSVKQLINSLNMDKKRKKSPGNKRASSPPKTSKPKKVEKNIQANGCQSVVRITGQIGLGDDNHIVLECGVEGKKAKKKYEGGYQYEHFMEPNAGKLPHTVNQGTQMDIDLADTARKGKASMFNNNVACYCNNMTKVDEIGIGSSVKDYTQIKGCPSPLVVITVYPNDDRCEHVKILKYHNQCQSPIDDIYGSLTNINNLPKGNPSDQYHEGDFMNEFKTESNSKSLKRQSRPTSRNVKVERNNNKRDTSQPRSPSTNSRSSPNVKRTKPKNMDKAKTNETRSPRNPSPSRNSGKFKPKEADNPKSRPNTMSSEPNKKVIKRLEIGNKNVSNRPKNVEKRLRSPSSSRSPSSLHSNPNVKRQGTENKNFKSKENKQQKERASNSIATNTDHILTKKALVDTFTKEIMGQMEKLSQNVCKPPQFKSSHVVVNIDKADENFDVLLQQAQGRMTTDIRVKKPTNYPCRTSCRNGNSEFLSYVNTPETSNSLLNMIDIDENKNAGYVSQQNQYKNVDASEIKVRDSLEIGHKRKDHLIRGQREEHTGYHFENSFRNDKDATESFAPVKHYRGDRCLVPNPIKRDKEIRQLLGLEVPSKKDCGPPCPCPIPEVVERHRRTCQLFRANEECELRTKKIAIEGEPRSNLIKYFLKTVKQTTGTQYEDPNVVNEMQNKMVVNQKIQVFLQVEKFSKDKPIILSRKQYQKVKKVIESTIFKHQKNKLARPKYSFMTTEYDKKKKVKRIEEDRTEKHTERYATNFKKVYESKETAILFTSSFRHQKCVEKAEQVELRQQYVSACDVIMKPLPTYNESSTKVVVGSSHSHSIHTIFKGLKKCRTPNLGTSTCSFLSNSTNDCRSKKQMKSVLDKPKKPFLKRLMSCLILRASTDSAAKVPALPHQRSTYNTSIDSYHISTSLGAIEMSSSIYDTSESFYSNHSIIPISSKHKREQGFFGSVRGMLTGKN